MSPEGECFALVDSRRLGERGSRAAPLDDLMVSETCSLEELRDSRKLGDTHPANKRGAKHSHHRRTPEILQKSSQINDLENERGHVSGLHGVSGVTRDDMCPRCHKTWFQEIEIPKNSQIMSEMWRWLRIQNLRWAKFESASKIILMNIDHSSFGYDLTTGNWTWPCCMGTTWSLNKIKYFKKCETPLTTSETPLKNKYYVVRGVPLFLLEAFHYVFRGVSLFV